MFYKVTPYDPSPRAGWFYAPIYIEAGGAYVAAFEAAQQHASGRSSASDIVNNIKLHRLGGGPDSCIWEVGAIAADRNIYPLGWNVMVEELSPRTAVYVAHLIDQAQRACDAKATENDLRAGDYYKDAADTLLRAKYDASRPDRYKAACQVVIDLLTSDNDIVQARAEEILMKLLGVES